jgi:hypothetical protein
MITHKKFAALRLKKFCNGDSLYGDEEDEHGDYLVESIRGIQFFRHAQVESGTLIICIDLLDHSTDAGPAILQQAGLPLTRRSSLSDAVELLGQPVRSKVDPDRGYDFFRSDTYGFVTPPVDGYDITCTWLHPGKVGRPDPLRVTELFLWAVRIERSDLSSFPSSDE